MLYIPFLEWGWGGGAAGVDPPPPPPANPPEFYKGSAPQLSCGNLTCGGTYSEIPLEKLYASTRFMYTYIYIYIYIERERERERTIYVQSVVILPVRACFMHKDLQHLNNKYICVATQSGSKSLR